MNLKKLTCLSFSLFLCFTSLFAQEITNEKIVDWKGYQRVEFNLNGVPAYYIMPHEVMEGAPWVWRARFPEWHTEMDEILLERGFHVAYINTDNQMGAPKAMMTWDDFYDYLTLQKGFSRQVVLEGVSRGGLFIYGWAKRNPNNVSFIYGEAPVCDFRSWPGNGEKYYGNWMQVLEHYGITEEEALNYKDMPKDNLRGLASFKVPILHVVNLQDGVVPALENTLPLVENYIKAGGIATVFPMSRGEQTLMGHHFPIEHYDHLAEVVYSHVKSSKPRLKSEDYISNFGNLDNFLYKLETQEEVTVAFFGGSITYNPGWRDKTMKYLKELYPKVKFNFINAGIPSLGSLPHSFRIVDDVLDKGNVDLMFYEAAVNDETNKTPLDQQYKAFEGIIRHTLKRYPQTDIITMAFADPAKLADYAKGLTPAEVKVHHDVSQYYGIPFLNLAQEINDRIMNGEFFWEYDVKDVHAAPLGQEIYFATIKRLFRQNLRYKHVEAPVTKARLPKPMSRDCYQNGVYVPIDQAVALKGFSKIDNWNKEDKVGKREGFVNVPVLEATEAGSELTFKFKGNAVGLSVIAGPDTGKIVYSIDGGEEKTMDLFTPWSGHLHLPWYVVLDDGLRNGNHTLRLHVSDKKNEKSTGHALRIFKFLVNKNN